MEVRTRISVPQMWTMEAMGRMQAAAKAANLGPVVLSSEPENALASSVHDIVKDQAMFGSKLGAGDHILVIDGGRGTTDVVMFELKGALTATSRLEPTSSSSGGACSAQEVNEILLAVVESSQEVHDEGGLPALISRLGLTDIQWRKRALRKIELFMRNYPRDEEESRVIRGENDESFDLWLTRGEVKAAFDQVLGEINALAAAEISKHQPVVVYVAGGFANNTYVWRQLEKGLKVRGTAVLRPYRNTAGEALPVSRGGLLRFDRISPGNLPNRYAFAILRDEVWDHDLHPDGVVSVGSRKQSRMLRDGKGNILIDKVSREPLKESYPVPVYQSHKDIVFESPYDKKKNIVCDRLCVFFEKDTVFPVDETVARDVFHDYYLSKSSPRLTATLVCISGEQKTHDASGRKEKHPTEFAEGIHYFRTVEKVVSQNTLKGLRDLEVKASDGLVYYLVRIKAVIKYRGGYDMTMGWVMETEDGEIDLWAEEETVWEPNFSQFVEQPQTTTGADGMDGVEESVTGGDEHGEEMDLDE
ncbi:hypothetical protein LTR56_022958 [Elasticomyces elasticus]|nr:hypothetical protein LTR56_022958 [Elasticomyces elasticus]KAK3626989.1 hypothetical protein LTR22_022946 [Elasticomyces elasticus]KAK4910832.1 hypothetical protein LTR49_020527 [Elasticomyces elasticus]KAK5750409.1 hypothetical protein LTS12_019517 [Elasticomyces elasticus]